MAARPLGSMVTSATLSALTKDIETAFSKVVYNTFACRSLLNDVQALYPDLGVLDHRLTEKREVQLVLQRLREYLTQVRLLFTVHSSEKKAKQLQRSLSYSQDFISLSRNLTATGELLRTACLQVVSEQRVRMDPYFCDPGGWIDTHKQYYIANTRPKQQQLQQQQQQQQQQAQGSPSAPRQNRPVQIKASDVRQRQEDALVAIRKETSQPPRPTGPSSHEVPVGDAPAPPPRRRATTSTPEPPSPLPATSTPPYPATPTHPFTSSGGSPFAPVAISTPPPLTSSSPGPDPGLAMYHYQSPPPPYPSSSPAPSKPSPTPTPAGANDPLFSPRGRPTASDGRPVQPPSTGFSDPGPVPAVHQAAFNPGPVPAVHQQAFAAHHAAMAAAGGFGPGPVPAVHQAAYGGAGGAGGGGPGGPGGGGVAPGGGYAVYYLSSGPYAGGQPAEMYTYQQPMMPYPDYSRPGMYMAAMPPKPAPGYQAPPPYPGGPSPMYPGASPYHQAGAPYGGGGMYAASPAGMYPTLAPYPQPAQPQPQPQSQPGAAGAASGYRFYSGSAAPAPDYAKYHTPAPAVPAAAPGRDKRKITP